MKVQLALVVFFIALAGCASTRSGSSLTPSAAAPQWQRLSQEPTPKTWHPGSRWSFVTRDGAVEFEVTDIPAETCISGEWKRLRQIGTSQFHTKDPAYTVTGRNLQILLSTDLCDAYHLFVGTLSASGFDGTRRFTGLGGSKEHGLVTGTPISK